MAKASGLRIGSRRFELVVLDGSPKRPKVVTSVAGEIPPDDVDQAGATARAIKAAIKAHGVSTENLELVIDARHAAFRNMQLPIEDASKIESVLKFEVESQLPQFNIDDVVVDFYLQDAVQSASKLLVTAVPKEEINRALEICNKAGFDPIEVEVETTALIDAAADAGLCGADQAHVVLHVGEESTAVAVVDGGRVRDMRVIHAGALTHTPFGDGGATDEEVAEEEAVEEEVPLQEGEEDEDVFIEGSDVERFDDLELFEAPGPPDIVKAEEIVQRIRRELARTISATRTLNDIEGVHITGFLLPGLLEADILGVPVGILESVEVQEHEGDLHAEYDGCSIAYGAALSRMGGGHVKASLRREELKFSGAMERLELPLAVMCLLITTLLGVWFMFLEKERDSIDRDLRFMLESSVNYLMGDPKKGVPGNLEYPTDVLKDYVDRTMGLVPGSDPPEYREDPMRNRYDQLVHIRNSLRSEQRELQKQLGHDNELVQPQSALKGLTLVLDLIAQGEGKYGRVAFHSLGADYRSGTGNRPDVVIVTLQVAFFADNTTEGTRNYEALFNDLQTQVWYVEHDYTRSEPITGAESGAFLPSVTIHVDVSKADVVTP